MPRHILDVRRVVHPGEEGGPDEDDGFLCLGDLDHGEAEVERRYPQRVRNPPVWMDDYETGDVE